MVKNFDVYRRPHVASVLTLGRSLSAFGIALAVIVDQLVSVLVNFKYCIPAFSTSFMNEQGDAAVGENLLASISLKPSLRPNHPRKFDFGLLFRSHGTA